MTPSKRSQLIQRTRTSASHLRGLAFNLPLSYEEKQEVYDAARNLEEAAHRVSLEEMDGATRELMVFAYAIVGISGFGLGVVVTLVFG